MFRYEICAYICFIFEQNIKNYIPNKIKTFNTLYISSLVLVMGGGFQQLCAYALL